MKYLGRFEVKLFMDGEDYRTDVGLELQYAPKDAIVGVVMTLIQLLAKLDPKFMDMLAKVMEAERRGEVEVGKVVDKSRWVRVCPGVAKCPCCGETYEAFDTAEVRGDFTEEKAWNDWFQIYKMCPHCGAHLGDEG